MANTRPRTSRPGDALRRTALLACVAIVAGPWTHLAIASTPAPQASEAAAKAAGDAADYARGRILIAHSAKRKRVYQNDPETGRISIFAATLDFLLRVAYSVHPRDIVYEVRLDRKALYDVDVIPPKDEPDTASRLMRRQLGETLGFEASLESREVSVNLIRRAKGAAPLEPSKGKARSVVGGAGRLTATGASMNDLARFTRTLTPQPVVNETGLEGVYDFVLEWDPSAGSHALRQAFEDLGLELVRGKRTVELLVVRARPAPKPAKSKKPRSAGGPSGG